MKAYIFYIIANISEYLHKISIIPAANVFNQKLHRASAAHQYVPRENSVIMRMPAIKRRLLVLPCRWHPTLRFCVKCFLP